MKYFKIFFVILVISVTYSCNDDFKNATAIKSAPSQYKYYLNNIDKDYLVKFKREFGIDEVWNITEQQENDLFFFLKKQASIILMTYSNEERFKSIMKIFALLNYKGRSFSRYNVFFLLWYFRYTLYKKITTESLAEFNGKEIFLIGSEDSKQKTMLNTNLVIHENKVKVPYQMSFKIPYGITGDLDLVKYRIEDFNLSPELTCYDLVSFFLNDKYFLSFDKKYKLLEYWSDQEQINLKIEASSTSNLSRIIFKQNRKNTTWCG